MRKYIVYYYSEINDECVEREIEVISRNIISAYFAFEKKIKVYKRVYKIEEKIN